MDTLGETAKLIDKGYSVQDALRKTEKNVGSVVESVAALKRAKYNSKSTQSVFVLGYSSPGDGGGGQYYFDSSSSEAEISGYIVVPAGSPSTGRWKLSYTRVLSVKQLGATGDGTTDDTDACQAALDLMPSVCQKVIFPDGDYLITTALDVPTLTPRCVIEGSGDGSKILASGCSAFTFRGQGYYRFTMRHLYLYGNNTASIAAIDASPSTVSYTMAGAIFENMRIAVFIYAFKLRNAQLCHFRDMDIDFTTSGGMAFYVVPDSGTGQACNSNRVHRVRVTGDAKIIDPTLPTASERATNWIFRECDIQTSGTTIPFTVPDADWVFEYNEFENNTGTYLIKITSSASLAGSYGVYIGNILTSSGSGAKILLEDGGTQKPYNCTFIGNYSTNLLNITGGRDCVFIANRGTITRTGGDYHIFIGGTTYAGRIDITTTTGTAAVGLNTWAISNTGTMGRNLAGTATLSSGTATVTFSGTRQEPDTNYIIALSCNANETIRWGSKATSGFTLTSSNGSSTATVDWHILR